MSWESNNQSGPPDLDQIWRNWMRKLRKTSSNGGGASFSSETSPKPWGVAIAVLLVLYLLSGIYIVQPAERAVITQFGAYKETVGPGPHWFARFIQAKQILDVDEVMTTQHGGMMLTEDENIVNVKLAVQYQVGDPREYLFNSVDPKSTLRHTVDSAIRYVIGHSTLDEILTSGRTLIASAIKDQIVQTLEMYHIGLTISAVAMQEAEAPEEVKAAFLDAIRAREDEERLVNQAEAYASKIEPIAEGHATRLLEDAKAYKEEVALLAKGKTSRFDALVNEYQQAPQVMRDRYYIDTMQKVLSSSTKVLVDVKKGNNFFYMPLDKLTLGEQKPDESVSGEEAALAVTAASSESLEKTPIGDSQTVVQQAAKVRPVVRPGRLGGE